MLVLHPHSGAAAPALSIFLSCGGYVCSALYLAIVGACFCCAYACMPAHCCSPSSCCHLLLLHLLRPYPQPWFMLHGLRECCPSTGVERTEVALHQGWLCLAVIQMGAAGDRRAVDALIVWGSVSPHCLPWAPYVPMARGGELWHQAVPGCSGPQDIQKREGWEMAAPSTLTQHVVTQPVEAGCGPLGT